MSSDNKSMSTGKTKYMISCAYGFGFNVGYSLLYIPKITTSFYIYIYIYMAFILVSLVDQLVVITVNMPNGKAYFT